MAPLDDAKPTTVTDVRGPDGHPLDIPRLACGAMADLQSFPAHVKHNERLGYPGELIDDWKEVAIAKIGELAD
ncbi:MAG: hypothetical protein HQ479_00100, partial [Rhodobacter sp.]|nr:hypothetical protein [Rhodobacter sp.]